MPPARTGAGYSDHRPFPASRLGRAAPAPSAAGRRSVVMAVLRSRRGPSVPESSRGVGCRLVAHVALHFWFAYIHMLSDRSPLSALSQSQR